MGWLSLTDMVIVTLVGISTGISVGFHTINGLT